MVIALTYLLKEQGSISSAYKTANNFSSMGFKTIFLDWEHCMYLVYRHTNRQNTHTYNIKINKTFLKKDVC